MALIIEILKKDNKVKKLEATDKALIEFISYLDSKQPGWEEFVLTGKFGKRLKVVKTPGNLYEIANPIPLAGLIVYLDKMHREWTRFAITKKYFREVKPNECAAGMLLRTSTSNTNQYIYVDAVETDGKGEPALRCLLEGKPMVYNSANAKKHRFKLLSESIPKEDYEKVEWMEKKSD